MHTLALALKNPWRRMIALDAAIMLGLFCYKALYHNPVLEYLHLIVDYHFGFAKRAFIGTLLSIVLPVVPVWFVYALGSIVWLVALVLFLRVFAKTFGFDAATAPLFAFIFGSPFFLKNFVQTIGYFDIYGCVWLLVMLLIPARALAYPVIGAVGGAVLILIHPVHMLLYVPALCVIVATRYYFVRAMAAFEIAVGLLLAAGLAAVFLVSVFHGEMPVPLDQLTAYLRGRAASEAYLLPVVLDIWYRPISDDLARTWSVLPENIARFPIFLGLIALHWPVIRYFRQLTLALANDWHRRLTLLGIAGVTAAYVIIGAVVFDYSRWFSSWATCMFLILHAVKMLPARETVPLPAGDRRNRVLGWLITAVPRIGITKPF
jgi:hypothetical protein